MKGFKRHNRWMSKKKCKFSAGACNISFDDQQYVWSEAETIAALANGVCHQGGSCNLPWDT